MSKWLSIVALMVSFLAIAISVRTYREADARATEAVERREQELVRRYTPEVLRVCEAFEIVPPSNPTTIEELIAPLLHLGAELDDDSRNAGAEVAREPEYRISSKE